jgi:transcriptional/translational regulatory protein YebC/TACO1
VVVNNYVAERINLGPVQFLCLKSCASSPRKCEDISTSMMASAFGMQLARRPRLSTQRVCNACRAFSTTAADRSGHSRWSTIKHDKAKNDKAKSKERGVLTQELINASQCEPKNLSEHMSHVAIDTNTVWGPDPKNNPRLQLAVARAKQSQIPKAIIEAAIARGQGVSASGQALEVVTIEAMLPGTVAAVVECMAENKARVLQDVRFTIKDNGGTVTPTTYLFEKKGRLVFEKKEDTNPDDYLDQAVEAGATDIDTDAEDRLVVYTEPTATKSVGEAMSASTGLIIEQSQIIWEPNKDTMVKVEDPEQIDQLEEILAALREESSVQGIYLNTTL